MSLLVVGTLAFDSVETPFGNRQNVLGGSASFLGMAASYFTPPRLVGVIGSDFPDEHLGLFKERGMDTAGIEKSRGKTFRWQGRYDHNLSNAQTLETQLNVLEHFDPKLPPHFRDSTFVVLGNFHPNLQRKVLEQIKKPTLVACDTMNYWIDKTNAELRKTLEHVDLLSINEGEARMLSGEYNLVHAAKKIFGMGPKHLVIKRGEYGALLFSNGSIFSAPAYPLEVIRDPTGAGDTFAGSMVGFLAQQNDTSSNTMRQAIVMGSVLASFVVEDFSVDRLRTLTMDEIRLRFAEFRSLTGFEAHGNNLWSQNQT